MYILTGIADNGKVRVLDTKDGVVEEISEAMLQAAMKKHVKVVKDYSLDFVHDMNLSVPVLVKQFGVESRELDHYVLKTLERVAQSKHDAFKRYLRFPKDGSLWRRKYMFRDNRLALLMIRSGESRLYYLTHWGMFVRGDLTSEPAFHKLTGDLTFRVDDKYVALDEYGNSKLMY